MKLQSTLSVTPNPKKEDNTASMFHESAISEYILWAEKQQYSSRMNHTGMVEIVEQGDKL